MQNHQNDRDNLRNINNAVEVPIPRASRFGAFVGTLFFALLLCGLVFGAFMSVKNPDSFQDYRPYITYGFCSIFVLMPVYSIVGPLMEQSRLKRVCKVRVTGTLVGYASEYVNNYDPETQRGESYYRYAPKYRIYINGRYEIRTVNDFRTSRQSPVTLELLANPNGYEIISTDGKMSHLNRKSIKSGIILLLIVLIIEAAVIFCFEQQNMSLFR